MRSATVATSNAERVVRFAVARGLDPKDAAEETPRANVPRIPATRMFGIWTKLTRTLADPGLPVALAERSTIEDLGLLGFATMTAPTARRGIETFIRYSALLADGARWELVDDGARLEVRLTTSGDARDAGMRISNETSLAQLASGARQLCGTAIDPELVALSHAPPNGVKKLRDFFRCRVDVGAPFHRIVFRKDAFDAQPRTANGSLWRWLCAQADDELRALAPRPLDRRVRDEIARSFAHDLDLDLPAVASRVGTSERTLRRALAAEGTSFRALVDDARKERTRRLLEDEDVPITRAAFEVGFTDASAFTHACRRWFGSSPRAYRATQRRFQ
jgi:AraC-like DNA-binding protein